MLEFGWIKISRKITRWRWYKDGNTLRLFLHLLLTANHEDHDFETITVKRGQRVASRRALMEETGMTERAIRTALNHLISTNEVTSFSTSKYTVITVNNYDSYQTLTNEMTSDRPAIDQLPTSDRPQCKKDKKDKKDKNNIMSTPVPEDRTDYDGIVDLYNSICVSYPKVKSLSETRRGAIRARLRVYSIEDFRVVFDNAEKSNFLKGSNNRNWTANFDWMLKDANFAKILEGNYNSPAKSQNVPQSDNADAYKSFIYNIDE